MAQRLDGSTARRLDAARWLRPAPDDGREKRTAS